MPPRRRPRRRGRSAQVSGSPDLLRRRRPKRRGGMERRSTHGSLPEKGRWSRRRPRRRPPSRCSGDVDERLAAKEVPADPARPDRGGRVPEASNDFQKLLSGYRSATPNRITCRPREAMPVAMREWPADLLREDGLRASVATRLGVGGEVGPDLTGLLRRQTVSHPNRSSTRTSRSRRDSRRSSHSQQRPDQDRHPQERDANEVRPRPRRADDRGAHGRDAAQLRPVRDAGGPDPEDEPAERRSRRVSRGISISVVARSTSHPARPKVPFSKCDESPSGRLQ